MRHLRCTFGITFLAAVIIALLRPVAVWATTNCYNYSNSGTCASNNYCSAFKTTTKIYCKQLCIPYADPGCCSYVQTVTYWSSINNGTCPCAGTSPTIDNTGATNTPAAICIFAGAPAPCTTDTLNGHCILAVPPLHPGS